MARPRAHLARAPIEEAIIEFRVQARPDLQIQALESLKDRLKDQFPQQTELPTLLSGINRPGRPARGWLLRSADDHYAARVCIGLVSFSQLRPYTRWEDLIGQAFRLWEDYRAAMHPTEVLRIGVRYINKIEVPDEPLARYLEAPPPIPAGSPQKLGQFLTRIAVNDAELSCQANVVQASGVAPPPDRISLLLDIDAFKLGRWPIEAIAPSAFEPLRQLKNRLFFAHLTEATVASYE